MGAVFLATHLRLQRSVACKLLPQHLSSDRRLIERFEREARALAKVVHPGIVPIHDMFELAGHYCIVMAYADGGSLGELLARQGPLPAERVAQLGSHAARALCAAARHGIVHRDVKPDNLLLTADGRLFVADFGLARVAEDSHTLTREGSMMGTPAFMAPEQWENSHNADHRADLYALGCTLYALLTGRPPFQGPATSEFIKQHLLEAPVPPRKLRPELPEAIERVVLKLLEKDPARRYPDGEALAVALDSCLTAPPLPSELEELFAEPEAESEPESETESETESEAETETESEPEPEPHPASGGCGCWLLGLLLPFAAAAGIFHEELWDLWQELQRNL